jgi:hypothetical protein
MERKAAAPRADFVLEADARELRRAIDWFAGWLPRDRWSADASLWLEGRCLVVRIGNDEARVPAGGAWPGIVVVPASFLLDCPEPIGRTERVVLAVDGDRIRIDGSSVRYARRRIGDPWPEFVEPLAPLTLLERLRLPERHSAEALRYSGLADAAEETRERLLEILARAESALYDAAVSHEVDPDQAIAALFALLEPRR